MNTRRQKMMIELKFLDETVFAANENTAKWILRKQQVSAKTVVKNGDTWTISSKFAPFIQPQDKYLDPDARMRNVGR